MKQIAKNIGWLAVGFVMTTSIYCLGREAGRKQGEERLMNQVHPEWRSHLEAMQRPPIIE